MLYGTGIRSKDYGGYIKLEELSLSTSLLKRIEAWLIKYEEEHYNNYKNRELVEKLDSEGIAIARTLQTELGPSANISYYSNASLSKYNL
jgi:hypothetical protein